MFMLPALCRFCAFVLLVRMNCETAGSTLDASCLCRSVSLLATQRPVSDLLCDALGVNPAGDLQGWGSAMLPQLSLCNDGSCSLICIEPVLKLPKNLTILPELFLVALWSSVCAGSESLCEKSASCSV